MVSPTDAKYPPGTPRDALGQYRTSHSTRRSLIPSPFTSPGSSAGYVNTGQRVARAWGASTSSVPGIA
eukprot:3940321-Rhodomonas_salina.12